MPFVYRKRQWRQNAPKTDQLQRRFRVTHPFHPLHGRQYELIEYRRSWGRECLDYVDEKGQLKRIPLKWTDAVLEEDPFLAVSAGRCICRFDDLVRLAELMAAIDP